MFKRKLPGVIFLVDIKYFIVFFLLFFFIGLDLKLSTISHDPELTFIIKPGGHHISSDLTATLPCDLDVTSRGWPRRQTRAVLSDVRIRKVKEAGMHLVPKGDEVWCISYFKCEKAVLDGVDSGSEYRKMCHQLMKRYVQIFSSKMSASGISSYIFKVNFSYRRSFLI